MINPPRTWHDFIKYLKKDKRVKNEVDPQLINGYLDYLISVTEYFEGVTMNLTNLSSLYVFSKAIKGITKQSLTKKFGVKERDIKIKDACGESWSGIIINFKKNKNAFHVFFGVSYEHEDEVFIVIQFFDRCSPSIKDKLGRINKDGNYFNKPEKWDNKTHFVLKTTHFKKLTVNEQKVDDGKKYIKQEGVLEDYFDEVISQLLPQQPNIFG